MNTCEYLIHFITSCLNSIISKKILIVNYYRKSFPDKCNHIAIENIVILDPPEDDFDTSDRISKKIGYKNFTCSECNRNIIGEIYMFNDNSFCDRKCRKKSMDKIFENY